MKIRKYKKFIALASLASLLAGTQACTDLDAEVFDRADASKFPANEEELLSIVGATYGQMRFFTWAPWELIEATTDEIVVPTRGPDWYDNGSWQQLAKHEWTPVSPGQINGAWDYIYSVVAKANTNIQALKSSPLQVEGKETIISELRVVRAFAYFWAMDMFGGVPLITEDTPAGNPAQSTRQQVFAFVETELKAALPNLKDENSMNTYGRFTKGAANALLAKLYLNAQVYTGTARWQDVVTTTNAIISSGKYKLSGNFLDNFKVNNHQNRDENIFVFPFDKTYADGMAYQWRTLHYAQGAVYGMPGNPWNGFATRAEFYNSFADNDSRKAMWLEGPQKDNSGKVIRFVDAVDNQLKDLNFTPQITSLEKAFGNEGVRSVKYEIQRNNTSTWQDNDMVVFRYADVLMMKAEAQLRLGNAAEALTLVNQVRARAGVAPMASVTLDDMLAERGREFAWEMWRRNDLIRFGKWNSTWQFKTNTQAHRALFPIPAQQLSNNPNLKQNPGY